jgi:hypothetical protein
LTISPGSASRLTLHQTPLLARLHNVDGYAQVVQHNYTVSSCLRNFLLIYCDTQMFSHMQPASERRQLIAAIKAVSSAARFIDITATTMPVMLEMAVRKTPYTATLADQEALSNAGIRMVTCMVPLIQNGLHTFLARVQMPVAEQAKFYLEHKHTAALFKVSQDIRHTPNVGRRCTPHDSRGIWFRFVWPRYAFCFAVPCALLNT